MPNRASERLKSRSRTAQGSQYGGASKASKAVIERLTDGISWLLLVLGFMVCVFGVIAAVHHIIKKPDATVVVTGSTLSPAEVAFLSKQLNHAHTGNFLTADLPALQAQALKVDWLERVSARRVWPNRIIVEAKPRFAVARFGSRRLIDSHGMVFSRLQQHTHMVDLPRLYGPDDKTKQMMQHFHQVNQWYKPQGIALTEVILTDTMTWMFRFDNGFRIITDKQNAQLKVYRLGLLMQHQLKPYVKHIESVDLRYRNGMAVIWKGGKPPSDLGDISRLVAS